MKFRVLTLFIVSILLFTSGCIPFKNVVLFQKKDNNSAKDSVYVNQDYEFTIAPFDILSIQVTNPADPSSVAPFSINPGSIPGSSTNQLGPYGTGILVDKNGEIEVPISGKVFVTGLTLAQAADTIKGRLSQYIVNTNNSLRVVVKIASYQVSVLGEISTQGVIRSEGEYMTVTEVLAKSGGFTDFSNRRNIKIIRTDRVTKKTTTYRMDLTSDEIVSPILARLQPNDVIYVEPLRRKQLSTINPILGFTTSVLSIPLVVYSLYNLFRR
jgi:polysaccharide export outer membrane protein